MIADVRALIAFRVGTRAHGPRRLALTLLLLVTVVVVAHLLASEARDLYPARAGEARLLLPTAYLGLLITAALAAIGSAGGRELILREHAVAYPVTPHVDHLGALLLSPLNLAWALQVLALLALTTFTMTTGASVAAGLALTVLWVATSTVAGQTLSWVVEWVRTLPHGLWLVRGTGAALVALVVGIVVQGNTIAVLDSFPTRRWALAAYLGSAGSWLVWAQMLGELLALMVLAYAVGLAVATALARRPRREESRAESRRITRRATPTGDLAALLRIDRASVWRSVPLRRGAVVLAVLPGTVAALGRIPWETMPVLPGLVASGAALLFGVNAWCLDGPGAWWRDSLPARPRLMLLARAIVVLETVVAPMALTLVLAVARARDAPTLAEIVALACASAVITGQVVSRSMDWAVRRPYAADLRGVRATPAPPAVMAGYSARLAITTTLTGIAYGACGLAGRIDLALLLTMAMSLFIARRIVATVRRWDIADIRSRVVATVASA